MAEAFVNLASEIVAERDSQFESLLITTVKGFRCLYASDHPDYYNMQQNKTAWLKIANIVKKPVTECMNKWYGLVQTFLYLFKLHRNVTVPTWSHYKSISEMQPYITDNYSALIQLKPPIAYTKPTAVQKDLLLFELTLNRLKLVSANTRMELRQQIWKNIADKLNAIPQGAQMPVLQWQKYWWEMKQNVGLQSSRIRMKLQTMGTQVEVPKFSEEDEKILAFCGATPSDNPPLINVSLTKNSEFGSDTDKVVRRCKKCTIFLNELLVQDYCETCLKIPNTLCDICSQPQNRGLLVYQVKNWSTHAKNLLPSCFYSHSELSICTACSTELKRQATLAWKSCRICECYHQTIEHLFSNSNEHLRKAFKDATKVNFNEFDGLPGYICKICKVQMQQFNNFYLRFSRAQSRLQEIHLEKFIGIAPGRPPGKPTKGPKSSVVSVNKVMILQPQKGASKQAGSKTETNYTLKPINEPQIPQTTNPTVIQSNFQFQAPGTYSPQRVHPEALASKRLQSQRTEKTKAFASPTNSGPTGAKRICLTQTGSPSSPAVTVAKRISEPAKTSKKINLQPISTNTVVGKTKGICTQHPGVASVAPTTVTKRVAAKTNTSQRFYKIQTGTIIPISKDSLTLHQGPASPMVRNTGATKAVCVCSSGSASGSPKLTNSETSQSSRIVTTQPSVFTISGEAPDFQKTQESPPIFCISKSAAHSKNSNHLKGATNLNTSSTLTDNTVPSIAQPAIKTEKIDDGYIEGPLLISNPDQLNQNGSTSNLDTRINIESSSNASTITAVSTSIQPTVGVRLNQPPKGGFVPIVSNNQPSFQNAFASTNFNLLQPRKTPKRTIPPKKIEATHPKKVEPVRKHPVQHVIEEQFQQQQQQHQQPPSASANKRSRKYWGAVDEFQINSVPEKICIKSKSVQPLPITQQNLPQWTGDSPATANSPTISTPQPPAEVVVKKERPEETSMFYPDSFELKNLALDADVSLLIKNMITKQETIDDNMKLDTESLKCINPSFLASYTPEQEQSKEAEPKKTNEPRDNEEKEKTPGDSKFKVKVPIKKLQVKLKRIEGLKKLTSRLKTAPQPVTKPIPTRKSLRRKPIFRNS